MVANMNIYLLAMGVLLLWFPISVFWVFLKIVDLIFFCYHRWFVKLLCNEVTRPFVLNECKFYFVFHCWLFNLVCGSSFCLVCFGVDMEKIFYVTKTVSLFGLVCEWFSWMIKGYHCLCLLEFFWHRIMGFGLERS